MSNDEIKKFIAEHIAQDISLSRIQDALLAEKGVKLTFMEVRMIAAELDTEELAKLDKPDPKAKAPELKQKVPAEQAAPEEEDVTDALDAADAIPAETPAPAEGTVRGNTTVEISKLVKPGTVMNGSVSFGSGVTADWFLDEMGRLALANVKGGKPDEMDIQEFQLELRKKLGA